MSRISLVFWAPTSGVHEPRRRSASTGGGVFRRNQRGDSPSATKWGRCGARHGGKRKWTPVVSSLNSHLPLLTAAQTADCVLRKATRHGLLACLSRLRSSLQTAYCYTGGLLIAERGTTVPRKNIFVPADYPNRIIADCNLLQWFARLLCRNAEAADSVAVMYLTSEQVAKDTEEKFSAVPYFAAVTCRQSAPDHPRERGDSQEWRETAGVYSFVPRRVGALR